MFNSSYCQNCDWDRLSLDSLLKWQYSRIVVSLLVSTTINAFPTPLPALDITNFYIFANIWKEKNMPFLFQSAVIYSFILVRLSIFHIFIGHISSENCLCISLPISSMSFFYFDWFIGWTASLDLHFLMKTPLSHKTYLR